VLSEEDEGSRLAWAAEIEPAAVPRLSAERVWIIDPLDGTREFAEDGRTDWAVHVALWARSAPSPHGLVGGAVALPAQHRVLSTDLPPAYPPMTLEAATAGAGGPAAPDGGRSIRLAASRSRPPVFLTDVAAEVGAQLVPMGSAGAKIAAVIGGEVDAYVHAGGQYEWDSAAPVAVAMATGLHASRIDGSALQYNQADPRLPDLVVCRKDLAPRLLAALQRYSR
jgi:3'(2'), 5'-bisphosphate nucleotidase